MFALLLCSYLASLGLKCVGDREELEINPGLCPLVHSKGCRRTDWVETVISLAEVFSIGASGMD